MTEPERRRGMIRIHADSIVRALYGNNYKAITMRISKDDRLMLDITVSHPILPEYRSGKKMIEIKRTYEQTQE